MLRKPAAAPPGRDPHVGAQPLSQCVFDSPHIAGGHLLRATRDGGRSSVRRATRLPAISPRARASVSRTDQPCVTASLSQAKQLRFLLDRQQSARVTLGELALLDQRLHFVGQLQQTQQVGYRRTVSAHQAGDLGLGQLELLAQALITGGLVDGGQIVALQVLDERQREQRLIVDFPDDRRDLGPAEPLDRTPAAFAGNQLELSVARTDDDRLKQTGRFDRRGQLDQCALIHLGARLIRIGHHVADRQLPQ